MEKQCVLCEVGTEFLNIMQMMFNLKGLATYPARRQNLALALFLAFFEMS
jgi:hypothetical protein